MRRFDESRPARRREDVLTPAAASAGQSLGFADREMRAIRTGDNDDRPGRWTGPLRVILASPRQRWQQPVRWNKE